MSTKYIERYYVATSYYKLWLLAKPIMIHALPTQLKSSQLGNLTLQVF